MNAGPVTLDAADETIDIDVSDSLAEQVLIQLVGSPNTPVANLELTLDGETWVGVRVTNLNSGSAAVNMTAAGLYTASVAGAAAARVRLVSLVSGSFTGYVRSVRS